MCCLGYFHILYVNILEIKNKYVQFIYYELLDYTNKSKYLYVMFLSILKQSIIKILKI